VYITDTTIGRDASYKLNDVPEGRSGAYRVGRISIVTLRWSEIMYRLAHDFATLPENSALSER